MRNFAQDQIIFMRYGGMMRTGELSREGIHYTRLQALIESGKVQKLRTGYYQWVDEETPSEVRIVTQLFPDAIFCMDTALWYYRYSDRTPGAWHLAVSKDSGKSRFRQGYPFVKPYYLEPALLALGLTDGEMDGYPIRLYDKDRTICDCLRYRNKMDRETFNKAVQAYVQDPQKNIPHLLAYAGPLRVKQTVKDLIGVWL